MFMWLTQFGINRIFIFLIYFLIFILLNSVPAFTRPTAFINLNPFFTGSEDYE